MGPANVKAKGFGLPGAARVEVKDGRLIVKGQRHREVSASLDSVKAARFVRHGLRQPELILDGDGFSLGSVLLAVSPAQGEEIVRYIAGLLPDVGVQAQPSAPQTPRPPGSPAKTSSLAECQHCGARAQVVGQLCRYCKSVVRA